MIDRIPCCGITTRDVSGPKRRRNRIKYAGQLMTPHITGKRRYCRRQKETPQIPVSNTTSLNCNALRDSLVKPFPRLVFRKKQKVSASWAGMNSLFFGRTSEKCFSIKLVACVIKRNCVGERGVWCPFASPKCCGSPVICDKNRRLCWIYDLQTRSRQCGHSVATTPAPPARDARRQRRHRTKQLSRTKRRFRKDNNDHWGRPYNVCFPPKQSMRRPRSTMLLHLLFWQSFIVEDTFYLEGGRGEGGGNLSTFGI